MKIKDLEKKLIERGIPSDAYSILKGELPNEQYCITQSAEGWEVYYSERGNKSGLKVFKNEEAACEYFFEEVAGCATK